MKAIFINADKEKIQEAVTEAINSLPSQTHMQENFALLASALTNECGVALETLCFRCIKTLPEQSELRVSITDGNRVVHRTIDISATSIANEKMKFVAIHE